MKQSSIILAIIIILVVGGGILVWQQLRKEPSTLNRFSLTSPLQESKEFHVLSTPEEWDKPRIAYREGGNQASQGGDLWLVSSDGAVRKKITNTGNVLEINTWSPDNNYLDVRLVENIGNKVIEKLAVVEVLSGEIKILEDNVDPYLATRWISNSELLYFNKGVIKKAIVTSGSFEVITDISSDPVLYGVAGKFSPNGDYLALSQPTAEGSSPVDLFIYNIKDKKYSKIASVRVRGGVWGWNGSDILYSNENNIVITVSPTGKERKVISVSVNERIVGIIPSKKGNIVLYVTEGSGPIYERKSIIIDIKSNSKREIIPLREIINQKPLGPIDCSINEDINLVACSFSSTPSHPIYVINLSSFEVRQVADMAAGYTNPISN